MASSCFTTISAFILWTHMHLTRGHIHHQCSNDHSRIIKGVNLHKIEVAYDNHPFARDPASKSRRSMLTTAGTSPIRISAYYDPVSVISVLSDANLAKLKASIGAIVSYYEKLIRVVPVSGTFYMDRFCNRWYNTPYGKNCVSYNSGSSTHYCQYATIPAEHLPSQSLFFYDNINKNESVTMLAAGRGIKDTDLLLYITYYNTDSCQGNTLAHAGPCAYDQYGRPLAGNINVCSYFFSDDEWKTDTDTMLHEMTHITIMLSSLWDGFRDASGAIRNVSDVYDDTVVPPILKTPILLQMVRDHFACPTAQGLPVQNINSSHWNERYTFSEIMNPTTYSQQMYYSQFTLALMQDSGWYLPNYAYAMPYYFGKDAGCSFFTDDCIDRSAHTSNYPLYYCESAADDGCNADYSAPSRCWYSTQDPPAEYQYFGDTTKGGSPQSDYCPWRAPYLVALPDFEGVCHDIRGNKVETPYYAEIWSSSSRCAVVDDKGYCYAHNCYDWDATSSTYAGVEITFDSDEIIDCSQSDKGSTKAVSSGEHMLCPDVDVVCGTNSNFGACYWGYYSDAEGACVCNAGYTGTDCNSKDNTTDIELILAPIVTTQAADSLLCLKGFARYPSYNGHHWSYFGTRDYNPVYHSATVGRYIWWHYWDHAWFISSVVGSSSYNCKCSVSEYTIDISECNAQWICSSSTQSVSQSLFGWCPDTPTFAPTTAEPSKYPSAFPSIAPSKHPTKRPTNKPTPKPSNNPTKAPTNDPTKAPTYNPTKSPTKNPTNAPSKNPTLRPSYNPSKSPTKNPTTASPTHDPTTSAPTMDGDTRGPTVDPTLSPTQTPTFGPSRNPTISPTNIPTKGTKFPTLSPTQMFARDIVIHLQYEYVGEKSDNERCNTTQEMKNSIRDYVDASITDLNVVLDEMNVSITTNVVLVEITFFSYSISEIALDEVEFRMKSDVFQQALIDSLDANDEYNCFKFVSKIFSSMLSSTADTIHTKDGDNKNAYDYNDGVHMFDFANYGTTEILVCILSGLILCICLVIMIYLGIKGNKWNKKRTEIQSTKSVEFGAISSLTSDNLFHQSLMVTNDDKSARSMHVVQTTPSNVEVPDNVALPTNYTLEDDAIDL